MTIRLENRYQYVQGTEKKNKKEHGITLGLNEPLEYLYIGFVVFLDTVSDLIGGFYSLPVCLSGVYILP